MTGHPILRAVAVAASAALLVTALAVPALAGDDRVTICHKPDTRGEKTIRVRAPAFNVHLKHGDYLGRCGEPVLAVAYSDLNGNHVFDTGDVLISQLVDEDGNGTPSLYDTVHAGEYPQDFAMTAFAPFGDTPHVVTQVDDTPSYLVRVWSTATDYYQWDDRDGQWEVYFEEAVGSSDCHTALGDYWIGDGFLVANTCSPSAPTLPVLLPKESSPGNDPFVEVDIIQSP